MRSIWGKVHWKIKKNLYSILHAHIFSLWYSCDGQPLNLSTYPIGEKLQWNENEIFVIYITSREIYQWIVSHFKS